MTNELIWVPKPDGKCWNSSRTRDIVDLAFTVTKETPTSFSRVDIRCSKNDEETGRARTIIGRMFYATHQDAKANIATMLQMAQTETNRDIARKYFLYRMLGLSYEVGKTGIVLNPCISIDGVWKEKSDLGMVYSTIPTTVETTSSVTEDAPTTVVAEVEPEPMIDTSFTIDTSAWDFGGDKADIPGFSMMFDSIGDVIEAINPVLEPVSVAPVEPDVPAAPQFITINGKQIEIVFPK